MRLFLFITLIGLLGSCADLQKEEQLAKIDTMNQRLDSLEKEITIFRKLHFRDFIVRNCSL